MSFGDYEYQQPSISVGLEKRIAKYWNWRTNLASAWRPPNVSELYSNGLHHGAATFEIGDTNLAREVSYNASMALAYCCYCSFAVVAGFPFRRAP